MIRMLAILRTARGEDWGWLAAFAALVGAMAALGGCDRGAVSADPEYDRKVESGVVALAAEAPDGTTLWAVTPPGAIRRVYFATSGAATHHSESCGKNCHRSVDDIVPTAR